MSISFSSLYTTLEWDKALENFLSQSLDPETGSLNIWNDVSRPKNLGHKDIGKTGINSVRGVIERWDGSTWIPLIGNSITQRTIKEIVKKEASIIVKARLKEELQSVNTSSIDTEVKIDTSKESKTIDENIVRRLVKEEINTVIEDVVIKEINRLAPILVERYLFKNTYNSISTPEIDIESKSPNNKTIFNIDKLNIEEDFYIVDIDISISEEDSNSGLGLYLTDESLSWKGNSNWVKLNLSNSSYDIGKFSKTSNSFIEESKVLRNVRLPKEFNTLVLVKNPLYITKRPDRISSYIISSKSIPINEKGLEEGIEQTNKVLQEVINE